ncbi:MAG: DUF2207 domain-containing protein [Acidimicrobiales bacterium]|nr:DUF2207 domain-containing protein [Acidimicrobiales bacterium]
MTTYAEKRRTGTWPLIIGSALFVGLVVGCIAYTKPAEKIDSYWTVAEISIGRTAVISEVIDYDFGHESSHGIYRDVPDLYKEEVIKIESPSAPDQWIIYCGYKTELCSDTQRQIRIGNPDKKISGNHRYEIIYSLDTLTNLGQSTVNWNAVGTGWGHPIDRVQIQLIAPFNLEDPSCSVAGPYGPSDCKAEQITPGHVLVRIDGLEASSGVNIQAKLGQEIGNTPISIGPPRAPRSGRDLTFIFVGIVALASVLIGGLISVWALRFLGRDKVRSGSAVDTAFDEGEGVTFRADTGKLSKLITLSFSPPDGISAHQGGILLEEAVTERHKTSWLLERAISGEIELTQKESAGRTIMTRSGRRPVRSRVLIDKFPKRSHGVLTTIFRGREKIELGRHDKAFASGWNDLEDELNRWMEQSSLWSNTKTKIVSLVSIPLSALCGIWLGYNTINASLGTFDLWTILSAILLGVAVTVYFRAWELAVRTPEGTGLWIQVEGFRRFLSESEARHVEAAAEKGMLREYTAWAVSLGEVERWKDAFRQSKILTADDVTYSEEYHFASYAFEIGPDIPSTQFAPSSLSSDSDWSDSEWSDSDWSGGFSDGGGGGGGGGGGSW